MTATHRAPAVTRAIRVLKLLGSFREPMGVNAVAKAIGVVPSSCLHILRALAEEGLVQMDPRTKHYSLGLGLLTLAHDMMGRSHFAKLVQPELERIALKHGVTATAVELDGRDRMVVVAMAQGSTILKIQVGVGSRFPAYISATGRCVAAHSALSKAQLKQRFMALQWQSAPDFEDWLRQVEAVRKNGIAVDPGNYICGFTVVAALVNGSASPKQAVSIVGVSEQLSDKALVALKRDTKEAAQRVSAQLQGLK
jgi:DNA-binding IclR family transcriptional regulator